MYRLDPTFMFYLPLLCFVVIGGIIVLSLGFSLWVSLAAQHWVVGTIVLLDTQVVGGENSTRTIHYWRVQLDDGSYMVFRNMPHFFYGKFIPDVMELQSKVKQDNKYRILVRGRTVKLANTFPDVLAVEPL